MPFANQLSKTPVLFQYNVAIDSIPSARASSSPLSLIDRHNQQPNKQAKEQTHKQANKKGNRQDAKTKTKSVGYG